MHYLFKGLEDLVGKKIEKVFINSEYLRFQTDQGDFHYTVYGDCCSSSYFHDFIGVEKLLKNGKVISTKEISLELPKDEVPDDGLEYIQCYGFEIVTEDPEFGEVTSVMSFRNSSNGYYGGLLETIASTPLNLPEITTDWHND